MTLHHYFFEFKALGGQNEVKMYVDTETQAKSAEAALIKEITEIEARYSRFKSDSLVSKINAGAGKSFIEVDEETAALIDYAALCYSESQGLFDITSGVLRKVWNFEAARIPSAEELDEVLSLIGWGKVIWEKPRIKLGHPEMQLDLGGLGKEYAVDRAAAVLQAHDIQRGLINFGGDVRVIGPQLDGRPWNVGIAHPRKSDSVLKVLEITVGALATSGDYERFFELDGQRYCHILNPKTGLPVTDFQSVSVLAPLCLVAGTASTIAMLLGKTAGLAYLQKLEVDYVTVAANGEVSNHLPPNAPHCKPG